jgi:hypothetical protein
MAFTKTPLQDTYQTKQIPLIYEWDNRATSVDGSVDSKQTVAQNVFFEKVESKSTGESYYHTIKRDGIIEYFEQINDVILGLYYWEQGQKLVMVTPATIFTVTSDGTTSSTATTNFAGDTINGVGFTEYLYENGDRSLVICGSQNMGVLNAGGVYTQITDPDCPTNKIPFPVFLDGYLFCLSATGSIHNSALNDPFTWSASDFINAESYPDNNRALARVGNYIVALGSFSIEWFYDAGNPTGTPLARVDGATQQVGYIQGLINADNSAYFVGRSNLGAPSVYKIEGLKVTEMGTPTVRRWLNTVSQNGVAFTRGHIFNIGGHRFYVVVQNRDETNPTQTYMLDLDNGMWSSLVLRNDTEGPFIFASASGVLISSNSRWMNVVTFFSEYGSKIVWRFSPTAYQDQIGNGTSVNFTCQFTTRPLDFGNYRMKFTSRLLFGTDLTSSTSLLNISWSDDDLNTFTSSRTVDLSKTYVPLWACGSFRKRAFKFTYADNFPMRWRSVEIDYNQGQA